MEAYIECITNSTYIKESTKERYHRHLTHLGEIFALDEIFISPWGILPDVSKMTNARELIISVLAVFKYHPSLRTTNQTAHVEWLKSLCAVDEVLLSNLKRASPTEVDAQYYEQEFYKAQGVLNEWLSSKDKLNMQQLLILLQVNMLITCDSSMMTCVIMKLPDGQHWSDPSGIMSRWSLEYSSIDTAVLLGEKSSYLVRMAGNILMELDNTTSGVLKQSYMDHPRSYLFVGNNDKPFQTKSAYTSFYNRVMAKYIGSYMNSRLWSKIVKHKLCNLGT